MTYLRLLNDTAPLIPKWASGRWYSLGGNTSSTSFSTVGSLRLHPIVVPRSVSIDAVGAEVTTVPTDTDVVIRFGIWGDDGTFNLSRLALDAGITSPITTLDFYSVTFSAITLTAGLWWLGGTFQHQAGGSTAFVTTNPAGRFISGSSPFVGSTSITSNSAQLGAAYSLANTVGAMPTSPSATLTANNSGMKVWVRCSALLS